MKLTTFSLLLGLSFEEASKHIVAWQAPNGMKQVNITMVDNVSSDNSVYIGTFGMYFSKIHNQSIV